MSDMAPWVVQQLNEEFGDVQICIGESAQPTTVTRSVARVVQENVELYNAQFGDLVERVKVRGHFSGNKFVVVSHETRTEAQLYSALME